MMRPALPTGLTLLLVSAALIVLVAGMRAAAPLFTPLLLALFLAVLAGPPLTLLCRRGLPTWAALVLVILGLVAVGGGLALLVSGSLADFSSNLPHYEERLKEQTGELLAWLTGRGIHLPQETLRELLDPAHVMHLAGQTLSGLGGLLADALMILLTVIFLLFEASQLPSKLRAALDRPEQILARLDGIAADINRYMAIKSLASLLTGGAVGFWLWLLGVDYPLLWALVAFLLNFVPTIGSVLAAVPAVLLALVQFGPTSALWVVGGYLVINVLVGNVLEPRVMGRSLGLSTLVVFISLVFWGWVLGPVGMFLSVPLTMTLKIVLESSPQTRPIAILLSSGVSPGEVPESPPQETY